MRTTIDIDDDVLAAAKDLAKAEGRTMGAVVSELARRGLTAGTGSSAVGGFAEAQSDFDMTGAFDWPTFPARGPGALVTSSMIEQIQDELDREDATAYDYGNQRNL